MKKHSAWCVCAAALAVGAVQATEWTLTVSAGETANMGPLVEAALAAAGGGAKVADGDVFVKNGEGTLIATNTWKNVKVNTRVEAGVYEARYSGDLSGGPTIAVRDGASLKINGKVGNGTEIATGGRSFYLRGAGHPAAAVTKNGRTFTGALVFTGTANYQPLNGCHFLADATGEAVIASDCAGNEGYLTYGWLRPSAGALRLVGPGHVIGAGGRAPTIYEHRYRYGYGYTNTNNKIVLDGAVLAGSSANYYARPSKVKLEVRNGGGVGPDNQSFLDAFSSIDFEWGTFVQGENAATVTLPVFSGLPFLSATVTPTVNAAWTVSAADLLQGRCMGAFKALTFGANAKLRVTGAETLDCTAVYTVATSAVSVAGLPVFEANSDEPRRWKTTAGADGKSVLLVYDPSLSEGVVNVRDWGVLPGAENAAANSSAFAAGLAQLSGTGNVVFFPQGGYFFDAPISVENASGLTLLGDGGFSQLQVTDAAAASVLSLTGGSDVTVTGLRFADCTGVAIAANGTANLTITNNVYTNVTGTIVGETDAVYPVLATDCTELFLQNNRVKGTAAYTGIVKMDGTSTFKDGSAPGEVWVWVWPLLDDSLRTVSFASALTSLGYAEYPQGAKFVKEGTGRFQGTGDTAVGNRLGAIDVRAGTFVGTTAAALGRSGNTVTVSEGATLLFEASGDTCSANGAKITFGGTGAATSGGGAICLKSTSWQCSVNCTYTLSSDAAIRACNAGSCGLFSECTLDQQGHTLMLRGDDRDRQIRFRLNCLFKNSAPIVVEGGTLSASYKGNNGFRGADGRRPPLLKIKARGRLLLNNQDFSDVFDVYEFEPGAQLNAESSQALFTANLVGAPTIQDLVKTYTVTNSFTARAADLAAGKSLTAVKAFALGANCTVDVDDPDSLPLRANGRLAQYVLATAEDGISGKPVKGANLAETTWQLRLVDGKTLLLAQPESTFLILR